MFKKLFVGALVVAAGSVAQADHHKPGHEMGPCMKDRQALCADKKGPDMAKCMTENKDKLSAECKAIHEKRMDSMEALQKVCGEDFKKHCGEDVKVGGGRKMKCIRDNRDKFSAECKAELDAKKEMHKDMHKKMGKGMFNRKMNKAVPAETATPEEKK